MLRAIDVQQVVMQLEQAEKVQRVEQHHPDLQQRYLELQVKEEKRLLQKKVIDAEEASRALIKEKKDREREKRAGAEHREDGRQAGQEQEDNDGPSQGGHINIKI
jgi:hypothetical protein